MSSTPCVCIHPLLPWAQLLPMVTVSSGAPHCTFVVVVLGRYEVFSRARVLVDAERGARVRTVLRNIFLQIRVLNNIRTAQEAGVNRAVEVFMRHSKSRTKRHVRRLSFVKRSGGKLASAPERA